MQFGDAEHVINFGVLSSEVKECCQQQREEEIKFGSNIENFLGLHVRPADLNDFDAIKSLADSGIKVVGRRISPKTFNKFLSTTQNFSSDRHHQKVLTGNDGLVLAFIRANHVLEQGVTKITHVFSLNRDYLNENSPYTGVFADRIIEQDLVNHVRIQNLSSKIEAGLFSMDDYNRNTMTELGYAYNRREVAPQGNGIIKVYQKGIG